VCIHVCTLYHLYVCKLHHLYDICNVKGCVYACMIYKYVWPRCFVVYELSVCSACMFCITDLYEGSICIFYSVQMNRMCVSVCPSASIHIRMSQQNAMIKHICTLNGDVYIQLAPSTHLGLVQVLKHIRRFGSQIHKLQAYGYMQGYSSSQIFTQVCSSL